MEWSEEGRSGEKGRVKEKKDEQVKKVRRILYSYFICNKKRTEVVQHSIKWVK